MGFITDFIGDITGSNQAADAASSASALQAHSAAQGIAEQQRQFDKLVELMSPYVQGGQKAFGAQQDLLGLGAAGSQAAAIAGIEGSPQFSALMRQGENAILQNASATGGLRGGNIQGALAQFRPQLLSQLIDQQFSRLGGVSQIGQAAASGQASAGIDTGANISNLFQQQGAAMAGGQLAQGNAKRQTFGDILKIGGTIGGFF
jgi:hypothetical protein